MWTCANSQLSNRFKSLTHCPDMPDHFSSYLFIDSAAPRQPLLLTLCTKFKEAHSRNEHNPFVNKDFTRECITKVH